MKIGGYTDKTGDPESNVKLIQSSASAVAAVLLALGGEKTQVEAAEGYEFTFAKIPAGATEEERKFDRCIYSSVRKK